MEFKVCNLKRVEIERIRNARAVWGHEKYGNRDEHRDHCLDIIEELLDVKNILDRTMYWIGSDERKKGYSYYEYYYDINKQVDNLISTVVDFDEFLRNKGIVISDKNGGERVGIKK